jgi:hypothetical protein
MRWGTNATRTVVQIKNRGRYRGSYGPTMSSDWWIGVAGWSRRRSQPHRRKERRQAGR